MQEEMEITVITTPDQEEVPTEDFLSYYAFVLLVEATRDARMKTMEIPREIGNY